MNVNTEREVVAKAVLRSECDNYFYEYLIRRREQASFVKEIQIENSCYCITLLNLKNDHELGVNAKSALDTFEVKYLFFLVILPIILVLLKQKHLRFVLVMIFGFE
jgi:hypothetical protein